MEGVWSPNRQTRHWRLDFFRPWRERAVRPRVVHQAKMGPPKRSILTFNVNGIWNKKSEVELLLNRQNVGIAAIQETLVSKKEYSLHLAGYEVYQRHRTKNFRGHALAIHKSLTSYKVGNSEEECFIHVKVIGLTDSKPWHVIAAYLPSGGNYRSQRTTALKEILAEYKKVITKEHDAKVIILGDFNMMHDQLRKRLKVQKTGLKPVEIRGSGLTFHRKSTRWSDIDSIVANGQAEKVMAHARVVRC